MNEEHLEAALIQCLAELEAGTAVEQLLARYPDQAEQLGPMLRAAVRLATYGQETLHTAPAAQLQARTAFLSQVAGMSPAATPAPRVRWLVRLLVTFVTVVALAAVVGGGVFGASASSLPGDPLYGIKRSFENIQLSLTFDPARRVSLEESYYQRRLEEVKAVQASRRATLIEFAAPIEAINAEVWTIGGLSMQVTPSTLIEGAPRVGELVQVTGHTLADGRIVADRIEAAVPRQFAATPSSTSRPTPSKASEPALIPRPTKSDEPSDTPEPTQAPAPARPPVAIEPTEPPELTGTPEPTEKPGAPRKAEPGQTPEPRHTPESPQTSEPRETPHRAHTPQPKTPEPTHSSEAKTPEPTEAHAPTEIPEP